MRIITTEDFKDIYIKGIQRGSGFIFSKISLNNKKRTKSSFNTLNTEGSNWWQIPAVKERWNYLITGDKNTSYEKYVSAKYSNQNVKLLSIGSGVCSHEIEFARSNPHWEITCIDFSEKLLQSAEEIAIKEGISNLTFLAKDIYKYPLPADYYDIILFHSSLHHFQNLEQFLERVHQSLVVSGKLIINEFVGANRLQYNKTQLNEINKCLSAINKKYRKVYKTNLYKNKYDGSGILRMIISDPSECIESENILPVIHSKFKVIEEKGYGGNLLMPVLKNISHNFFELNDENKKSLDAIFEIEDKYLQQYPSDFVFGIYERIR